MLVLSRKIGERIKIGDDIYVTVVGHRYGQVRIGIEAPPSVDISRLDALPQQENPKKFDRSRLHF